MATEKKYDGKGLTLTECLKNQDNIYALLHEFRNWDREWNAVFSKKPKSIDEFVSFLSKKWVINPL